MTVLLVVAKAPEPGRVKTRLTAALSPEAAAGIAAAALLDTLDAVRLAALELDGPPPVVALTGRLAAAVRADEIRSTLSGCTVIGQRGTGLAERLVHAHADAAGAGPVVQIGMDTPQAGVADLVAAARSLGTTRAVLGPAVDGGWWLLGLRDAQDASVLRAVPMSLPTTGADTVRALQLAGLPPLLAGRLRDVDRPEDLAPVAALVPGSRFAVAVAALREAVAPGPSVGATPR